MKDALREACALLQQGEIVALPTETVYGLAADAFNPTAVAKIFAAKERPSFDPLIVHIASRGDLKTVAIVPEDIADTVNKLISAFWPGPLTLILPKHPDVADLVTSGLPTVAVRQSAHPVFRAINKALGHPIAAPSANRFGSISPTSASAVIKELGGRIPLVIDAGACCAYELLKVEDPKKRRRLAEQVANNELSLVKLREKIEGRPSQALTAGRTTTPTPGEGSVHEDGIVGDAPRPQGGGAPADNALVSAKQNLNEALEQLADILGSSDTLSEIGETDRTNLAKYLTIAKLRLENAITVVRSGHRLEH